MLVISLIIGRNFDWLWLKKGSLLVLIVWNLIVFAHAMQRSFTRPDGVPSMMRLLGIFAAVTAAANVILVTFAVEISTFRLCGALVALAVSQIVFRFANRATCARRLSLAFSEDVPEHLNRSGPYRWIRHPFYTSYWLTWLGGAFATADLTSIAAAASMATFYYVAAIREENKFLRSPLALSYRDYQQSTGMFFPPVRSLLFPNTTSP